VGFAQLERWDVSGFTGVGWQWPANVMQPLGKALRRVVDEVPASLSRRETPIIEKITFGGALVVTEPAAREGYKGRLFRAPVGSLIYSKIRVKQGSVTVVSEHTGEVAVSSEYPVYKIAPEVADSGYLILVLGCSAFQRMLDGLSHGGSTKTRIHPNQFETLEIPLPPLATQQAIVRRWREARAAAEAAEREAGAVEREAARDFLHGLGRVSTEEDRDRSRAFALSWGDIERWGVDMCWKSRRKPIRHGFPTARIKELCKMGSGGTPSRKIAAYFGGSIPWVKTTEVRNGIVTTTEEHITEAGLNDSAAKLYPAGSLIVAMYGQGATRGRTAKLGMDAATNQACCVLHGFDQRLLPDYLWYYLMAEYPRLRELASGNNQPNLNAEMIANYEVPLPSLEVQHTFVTTIEAARQRAAALRTEAQRLRAQAAAEAEAAILGQPVPLAAPAASGVVSVPKEPHHDRPTTPTPRPTPEGLARRPSGRGQPARGLSRPGDGVHAEFHGPGERAGGPQGGGGPADSTRPLDATREPATAAGSLTYTQVSERLAAQVADCLDELLDADPGDIAITPEWLRDIHQRIAGGLFPDWAGRFRTTDVQVGTHFPPPAHAVPARIRDFCLDLEERLRHLDDAASTADVLAWVDWRFQWIHPFKDFNGRVGRVLLVALAYKLGLPPLDPADVKNKDAYFSALRAADAGDHAHLRELWLARLTT